MKYTYFITTPGYSPNSYIARQTTAGRVNGSYFKFGDTNHVNKLDIRNGYTTHNPDIGVFALLRNDATDFNLGTAIKAFLREELKLEPVSGEWFFADFEAIKQLRKVMRENDELAFDVHNAGELLDSIKTALTS
ncbi:hypothetical protein DK842_01295 [Chromobacterium phragmitis]|uniref:GIY-YIG nuclease family protein n=1 Tax=Chromobacterium phragmitis TaxID=2202141 RepID=A0A344UFE5_9NEIS|nr:hypothetical protein [Chromobacterium phragmitis]AXE28669.1 hypothetical protein DK842_01295 [Chromobacterium phragmitis]AXE33993.1 hypothetical protein DK843_06575 [Chromobacterium phragmitis]